LYQLKNDATLVNATFEDIWQQDRTVLEDDLINVVEITMYPGKTNVIDLEPDEAANKLGVVALFREPQGKDWYVTYEIDSTPPAPPCPSKGPRISVFLDRMQIQDGEGRASDS
jgi:type VI secretion system protein VasD